MGNLFDTLCIELRLDNIEEYKDLILTKLESSPRILKNFFRKILIYEEVKMDLIEKIVKETIEESV